METSIGFPLKVVITESFKKDFNDFIKGNVQLEKKLKRNIDQLKNGRTNPGMNLEKIQGFEKTKGLKSVRLNSEMRFSVIISDKLFLLRINHHADLYRKPF
jgi:mRNA-degrading endonuclease YafQ of YafQ-DinJ toxin-antitoxin module